MWLVNVIYLLENEKKMERTRRMRDDMREQGGRGRKF